jgi:hypothetical protein
MGHEWVHSNVEPIALYLYHASLLFGSLYLNVSSFVYYAMGHMEHHEHNGDTLLTDFLREPWFPGHDADVLFFGFTLHTPLLTGRCDLVAVSGPV